MQYLCIGLSIAVLLFVHFYKLIEIPFGIHIDEAGAAYDGWCLANFGVDRFQNSYPVYFANYGGGQNALLTYILMILYKLFGYSNWYIRGVMGIASLITAFFGYRLVGLWTEKVWEKIGFLALYSVMPIFIMIFRVGIESTLLLCVSTVFLFYFCRAVTENNRKYYVISGFIGGIMLYTYALVYIVLPMVLLLSFVYIMAVRKEEWKTILLNWFMMAVPLAILAFPLIWVQIINIFNLPEAKMGVFTITKLPFYRGGELSIKGFFRNLPMVYFFTHFYDELSYNTLSDYGTMYFITIPFVLIGFFCAVKRVIALGKRKETSVLTILIFWYLAEYAMGAMLGNGSPAFSSRMNGIFLVMLCFAVIGLSTCIHVIGKWFGIAAVALYGILFCMFSFYYFGDYTEEHLPDGSLFSASYDELVDYLEAEGANYVNAPIYLENKYGYYAISAKYNPLEVDFKGEAQSHLDNVYFGLPEHLDYNGNYVIYQKNEQSRNYLKESGYREVPLDEFCLYVSPVSDLNRKDLGCETLPYQLDSLTFDKEGNFYISGWIYHMEDGMPASNITVKETKCMVEQMERPDVAVAFALPEDMPYGFRCMIEKDDFEKEETFTIMADGTAIIEINRGN